MIDLKGRGGSFVVEKRKRREVTRDHPVTIAPTPGSQDTLAQFSIVYLAAFKSKQKLESNILHALLQLQELLLRGLFYSNSS